ncbi:DUF1000-domain-containing protein [Ascodesmis nigricans]|uniref:DUF1000-domain-containing protein n=1 Tax=Ascodesmis nigricans TaxID=341454 RepID=A0A4S2MRS5_9PEZI|nr:DUF1000-domain-containing protein [Ascodesmis nigricans]
MSEQIISSEQLQAVLSGPKLVVIHFYKDHRESTDIVGGLFGKVPMFVTYARCNYGEHPWAEREYNITQDPTYIFFRSGTPIKRNHTVQELTQTLTEFITNANSTSNAASSTSTSTTPFWLAKPPPGNFVNLTDHIEKTHLDIMNANSDFGSIRTLLEPAAPSTLSTSSDTPSPPPNDHKKDWVESDTDEQLMLFLPFQTAVKLHSIHITSLPPSASNEDDDDEEDLPSRPQTLKIFTNTNQILSFDDADSREPTQTITFQPSDWDPATHTAVINTRFVKFQNCSSVTIFIVDVEREGAEKCRVDRVRLVGEKLYEKPDLVAMKKKAVEEEQ